MITTHRRAPAPRVAPPFRERGHRETGQVDIPRIMRRGSQVSDKKTIYRHRKNGMKKSASFREISDFLSHLKPKYRAISPLSRKNSRKIGGLAPLDSEA